MTEAKPDFKQHYTLQQTAVMFHFTTAWDWPKFQINSLNIANFLTYSVLAGKSSSRLKFRISLWYCIKIINTMCRHDG